MAKGKTNNPNGRPAGKPNKITGEVKQWIFNFIQNNKADFEKDYKSLDPEKRVMLFEKLLQYVIPRQQSVNIEAEYKELERLLMKTPDSYVEQISEKILMLNKQNTQDENE